MNGLRYLRHGSNLRTPLSHLKSEEEEEEFINTMTEDEKSEMERFDVNYEQLELAKTVLQDKCNGDISKFRQEYPSDPEECFLMSSRPTLSCREC